MRARLVQIENGYELAWIELDAPRIRIGRDPSVEFSIDDRFSLVSRHHIEIARSGNEHVVIDLGASNGTWLNGQPLVGEALLQHGDRIDLAGQIEFAYEADEPAPSRLGRTAAVLALAALLGALYGLAWWALEEAPHERLRARLSEWYAPDSPAIREACALAQQGIDASRADQPAEAVRYLRQSVRTLLDGGELEDVKRHALMVGGLEVCSRRTGTQLMPLFEAALERRSPPAESAPPVPSGRCRLDRARSGSEFDTCLKELVEYVMTELRQDPSLVPEWFYGDVAKTLVKENDVIRRAQARGTPYIATISAELQKRHMPPMLHYLASIESGYREKAGSPAGARGMWQFIKGTAARFDLKVTSRIDERNDWRKSTAAAAEYLRQMALEFGGNALLLSLAGYNRGEAGVRRSLRSLENPFEDYSYWRLSERQLLPKETRDYVPRFIAHAVAGEGGLPDPSVIASSGY